MAVQGVYSLLTRNMFLIIVTTPYGKHHLLVHADDVNIFGENLQTMCENREIFIKVGKNIILEINSATTEYRPTELPKYYARLQTAVARGIG